MKNIDYLTLLKHVGLYFLVTFGTGFLFGIVKGIYKAINKTETYPLILDYGQGIGIILASIYLFCFISSKITSSFWLHCFLVGIIAWLLSYPLNVLIFGQSMLLWAYGILPILFSIVIGVLIRIKIQNKTKVDKP